MNCIPTPDQGDRWFVGNRVIAACCCWMILLLPFAYAPFVQHGPVLCPLHALAGLPCPGCGMTRAFCALSRLDLWDAVEFNALCFPLVLLLLATPPVALYELAHGKRCRFYHFLYSSRVAWCCGAVVVAYHLGRVAWWTQSGTLVEGYLKTSWTYQMFSRLTN